MPESMRNPVKKFKSFKESMKERIRKFDDPSFKKTVLRKSKRIKKISKRPSKKKQLKKKGKKTKSNRTLVLNPRIDHSEQHDKIHMNVMV